MWNVGRDIYETGTCHVCHGAGGKNGPYGPDLADNVFLHNTGEYEDILAIIIAGVPEANFKSPKSFSTFFMLPLGGMSGLTDAEVRSVAAYVWALSHPNG